MDNFINMFSEMMKDPKSFAMKNFGVTEDIANDPDKIIQSLMNNGKITQMQYDRAKNAAMQMRNNPMIQWMLRY